MGRTPTTSAQLTITVCDENERRFGEGYGKSPIASFTIGDNTLIFFVSVKQNLCEQRCYGGFGCTSEITIINKC